MGIHIEGIYNELIVKDLVKRKAARRRWNELLGNNAPDVIMISITNESDNITVGINKITFRLPYDFVLTEVRANVNTAPTGSNIIVDIFKDAVSILGNKLTIDVGDKTSLGSSVTPTIITEEFTDDDELTVDVTQVGSIVAGKGLKIVLIGQSPFVP